MAKKAPAKKAPVKRKPRAKKPVEPAIEQAIREAETFLIKPSKPIAWRSWVSSGLKAVALIAVGIGCGVWASGGIEIGPGPVVHADSLSQSHTADRISQVRILREYAGKTFPDEPAAQAWLNEQRIEARKTDFIPYTDELGQAADTGADAVKALADKLEVKP